MGPSPFLFGCIWVARGWKQRGKGDTTTQEGLGRDANAQICMSEKWRIPKLQQRENTGKRKFSGLKQQRG